MHSRIEHANLFYHVRVVNLMLKLVRLKHSHVHQARIMFNREKDLEHRIHNYNFFERAPRPFHHQ